MASRCSICQHDQKAEIDLLLASGTSIRDTAGQYHLSKSSVSRHKKEHLGGIPAAVAADKKVRSAVDIAKSHAIREAQGVDVFRRRFEELRQKVDDRLGKAETANDDDLIVKYLREARGLLDLESKVVLQILGLKDNGDDRLTDEDIQGILGKVLAVVQPCSRCFPAIQQLAREESA